MVSNQLKDRILRHVKDADRLEPGDCWLWAGSRSNGVPTMCYLGNVIAVRRAILQDQGVVLGKYVATYSCMSPLCVCPEHTVRTTRLNVQERATKARSYQQGLVRRTKLAAAARARLGKLTPAQVAEIRADPRSQRKLAAVYGVTQTTIGNIKRGATWRDYSNPFAALGAI